MQSQNYNVAAQRARADQLSGDVYKPAFSVPGQTDYVWRGRSQSLHEILKEDSLPLVVKLCQDNIIRDEETPIDLQQPMLLFKEIKARKLHARNLKQRDSAKDSKIMYQTVGHFVTFPESFSGYFRALETPDKPLFNVADIARYMPKAFISSTPCDGFHSVSDLQNSPFQSTPLPPGLYHAKNILEDTITYINKRKHEKRKLVRCLYCKDHKDKSVLFPLDGKGQFYLGDLGNKHLQQKNIDPGSRLSKWPEFCQDSQVKGIRVKMVYGQEPKEECQFTGILEFSHVTEEHTIVGCTISPDSPRLFEITVTSEPFFIAALNSGDYESGSPQQKSLKFVKKECDSYIQCAKVKRDYDIDDVETD